MQKRVSLNLTQFKSIIGPIFDGTEEEFKRFDKRLTEQ